MSKSHPGYTHVKYQLLDKLRQKEPFHSRDQPKTTRKNLGPNKNKSVSMLLSGSEKQMHN